MQNYVALYGFLRTVTLVAVIDFWLSFLLRLRGLLPLGTTAIYCSAFAATAFLSFLGFTKFFRRFTLEALMAMSVTYEAGGAGA